MLMELLHSHKFCILFFSLILAIMCCCLTVSATEVDQSTDEVIITETDDLGVSILNDSSESTVTESETTTNATIDDINGQLNLISGILVFFVIVVLFYFAYKFFNMFF